MEVKITKTYTVFPVSRHAKKKTVTFNKDGVCIFDIELRLDYAAPDYDVYVDMQRFEGESLDVLVSPEMKLEIKQKDRRPVCRFSEPLRPKYHFTSPEGWINDPNGLVYQNGLYHMFYQLNPAGTEWGNMHWGHAVSSNLTDWEHRPIALFPDTTGAMFSGGAIIDSNNLLNMKTDAARTAMLIYYTAAGNNSVASAGQPFTQCMAVSLDGGETFTKLPSNPVIPHIEGSNRDPKVVYSARHDLYVMSLYLAQDRYAIFTSKDLKQWERIQDISLPGDDECPAFFPLSDSAGEKWVFMGARDRYTVGDFDGERFVPDREGSSALCYSGTATYAAQRFENLPDLRTVRFAWMKTDFFAYGMPFNGAFSVPQELTLVRSQEGCRVYVNPAREIEKLRGRKTKEKLTCTQYSLDLVKIAQDITLVAAPQKATRACFSLFGSSFEMNFAEGTFTDGRNTAPMPADKDGRYRVRLLTDTCGIEIYISGGFAYMAQNIVPDANLSVLKLEADSEIELKSEVYRMRDSRKTDKRK